MTDLVKYATNGFLAAKISYANEIAAVCDGLKIDAVDVLRGLGMDRRVGPDFLRPGPGYGGSCLPKDLKALNWAARRAHVRLDLVPAVERANKRQRHRLVAKLSAALGGLAGKTVTVWGLAFKAGTDDLREAAALEVVPRLLALGAQVRASDPVATPQFALLFPPESTPGLSLFNDPGEALDGADGLLILTEWEHFRAQPPAVIALRMAGRTVVDARNLLEPDAVRAAGLTYRGVGRGRAQ